MSNLSSHASAAKAIRDEAKRRGIKASVRSRSFSMGNAVDVEVEDLPAVIAEAFEKFCAQFQYGSFDGMTDFYSYDNRREDLPQVKYVHLRNSMSQKMREEIYAFIRVEFAGGENLPARYLDASSTYCVFHGQNVDQFIQRQFFEKTSAFWQHKEATERRV